MTVFNYFFKCVFKRIRKRTKGTKKEVEKKSLYPVGAPFLKKSFCFISNYANYSYTFKCGKD